MAANAQDATEAPMMGDGIKSVCLVTDIGHIDDGNFNQFAYEGMEKAVSDFALKDKYIETQFPTEYENNIDTCLGEGFEAIVTVGFALGDNTYTAAKANPDVYFIGVDQDQVSNKDPLPNLVGIQYREDQAGFLVGALAALMSKSGSIAGVYGIPFPAVVKYRNGYEQGARYINPDIHVSGVYIDSFEDRTRGASAAAQLIGEGADVVFGAGGKMGSGAIVFAAQNGVYAIGVDKDEYFSTFGNGSTRGSQYLISSAVKRVDLGVYNMLEALVNGTGWLGGQNYILELANDGIDFAPPHDFDVPQAVEDRVNEVKQGLLDGTIETGIDLNSGNLIGVEAPPPVVVTAEPTSEATPAS